MKEKLWSMFSNVKTGAWIVLIVSLLMGVLFASVSETSATQLVSKHIRMLKEHQRNVVQAATIELAETLKEEAIAAYQAKLAMAEPTFKGKLDSPVIKESFICLEPARKGILVGIDPGHLGRTAEGYVNTGALSLNGIPEYDFAFEIGLLLKEELISRGYDVFMVRNSNDRKNYKLTVGDRAILANEAGCDILVCLHWDSNADQTHHGYHTIYKGNKKTKSYRLALAISDTYGAAMEGMISRLCKPRQRTDLWQLNWATMPTTLIEFGYASNENDVKYLTDPIYYPIMVDAVADGIDNYFAGETTLSAGE